MMKYFQKVLLPVLASVLLASSAAAAQECPPASKIADSVMRVFKRQVEVKEIYPAKLDGVCEIVVLLQGQNKILYSDSAGKFLLTGNLIDVERRRDITREKILSLNRFTPEEMKKLNSLAALTVGESGPEFYFVTDPM